MRLTFLWHASWLIQSETTTVVCDLLVENFFRNGTFTICPTREFDFAAMPRLDAAIITHRHRDHFDFETLLQLDRGTKILCPRDRTILRALDRFGYRDNLEAVDLVAHGYQPMLETAALEAQSMGFPVGMYSSLLHRAKLLAPRALVPGSNGYRTAGAQAWFNAYKFPISRERFVRDVAKVLPETTTFIPNPGAVMVLDESGMHTERQGAHNGFVSTPVNDAPALMAFDPSRVKPNLRDENPSETMAADLHEMTRVLFEERVVAGCKAHIGRYHALRMIEAVLEVRVVYPDESVETWVIDLAQPEARVALGARGDDTDIVMSPPAVHRQRGTFPWLLFSLIDHQNDFEARQVEAEIDCLLGDEAGLTGKPLWQRPALRTLPAHLASRPKAGHARRVRAGRSGRSHRRAGGRRSRGPSLNEC